jgi:predicted metalloprotease with PDZ domain
MFDPKHDASNFNKAFWANPGRCHAASTSISGPGAEATILDQAVFRPQFGGSSMNRQRGVFLALAAMVLFGLCAEGQPPEPKQPKDKQPPKEKPGDPLVKEGLKNKLGVIPKTLYKGALIVSVVPNSPAAKAKIEPGDIILSVDGFQIGFIEGMEFPLQSEIRRIKGTGTFEVKDHKTGKVSTKEITITADAPPDKGPPPDKSDKSIDKSSP